MNRWMTKNDAGQYVFGGPRTFDLSPSQAEAIDLCIGFCEKDIATLDDAAVSKAKAYADNLERLTLPDGYTYNPADPKGTAIKCTIEAVRDHVSIYERKVAEERAKQEQEALDAFNGYSRALADLARAAEYLNGHDRPEIPARLRDAAPVSNSLQASEYERRIAALARQHEAASGLTAKGKKGVNAFVETLTAIYEGMLGDAQE